MVVYKVGATKAQVSVRDRPLRKRDTMKLAFSCLLGLFFVGCISSSPIGKYSMGENPPIVCANFLYLVFYLVMTQFYDRQSLSKHYDDDFGALDAQSEPNESGFWQELKDQNWWNDIVKFFEKRIRMKTNFNGRRSRM